jgi:hypothetical protein
MASDRGAAMRFAAVVIGFALVIQGIFGIAAPDAFVRVLRVVQTPPVIYGAAIIRVAFGVVLFKAAPASRTPTILRVLGALITLGGLLTPFFGVRIGHAILDAWTAGGPDVVRMWAGFSLALGVFVIYSTAGRDPRSQVRPWQA